MDKMFELARLIEEAEHKLMGICEDGYESMSTERWAEIDDGVSVALQALRQQIVLLCSLDKKAAKAGGR
jgi:hypothetical protein